MYTRDSEALATIKSSGNRIFVATSKPTVFAKQVIEHFQLTNYFEDIIGSNLDGTRIKRRNNCSYFTKMKN